MADFASAIRVWETTTDISSPYDLAGVSTEQTALRTFVAAGLAGKEIMIMEVHSTEDEWQWSRAVVTDATPDTYVISKVIKSSNSDAQVTWTSGTRDVFVIDAHGYEDGPVHTITGATTLDETYRMVLANFSSSLAITLPPVADYIGKVFEFKSINTGTATITEDSGDTDTIETTPGVFGSTKALDASGDQAAFFSDGTKWRSVGGGEDNLGSHTATQDLAMAGYHIDDAGVVYLNERAAAEADVAGDGQIWVKTATPNQLWFTDDAGTDFQVATLAGTETLTNKTINTASNTITVNEADISDLGTTAAMVADDLSVFAATTSAQLAGVISDETGSGSLVFATSPTLTTPVIGVATGDVIYLNERAAAAADVAGDGQIWVKTATPNQLWFTDDAGTDFQLGVPAGSDTQIQYNNAGAFGGISTATWDGTTFGIDSAVVINESGADVDLRIEGTNDNLLFADASTNRIGIGTATPQTQLDVAGPIGTGEAAAGKLTLSTVDSSIDSGDMLGRIYFQAPSEANGGDAILASAAIWGEAEALFTGTVNNQALVFGTATSSAAIERVRIDASGNLGVGTSTPQTQLDVAGPIGTGEAAAGKLTLSTVDSSIDSGDMLGRIYFQAPNEASGGDAALASAAIWGEAEALWSSAVNNQALVFGTATSSAAIERVRIDASGNLGVGTSTPNGKVDVAGTIFLAEQAAADADVAGKGQVWVKNTTPNELWFTDDAGTDTQLGSGIPAGSDTQIQYNNAGAFGGISSVTWDGTTFGIDNAVVINESGADVDLRIEGNTDTDLFFIDASTDRVGISTSTPLAELDVDGTVLIGSRSGTAPGAQSQLDIRGPIGTGAVCAGILTLGTRDSSISDGDQVGRINFQAPEETGGGDSILPSAAIWGEAEGTWASGSNSQAIVFGTATTSTAIERIRIDATGNVLLGTTTPPTGTEGKVLTFGDNTGDPTPGTNTAGVYAKDVAGTVEMFAIDEAANATQLSPHDPDTGEWVFYSENVRTGRKLKVRIEELAKRLAAKFPRDFADLIEESASL